MFELISSRCGTIFWISSVLGFQPLSLHSLNLREKIHEVAGRILVLRTLEHASPTRLLDLRLSSCYRAACAMSSQPICPKSKLVALSTTSPMRPMTAIHPARSHEQSSPFNSHIASSYPSSSVSIPKQPAQ